MKKKAIKLFAVSLLSMMILGSSLSAQADSPKEIKPVVVSVVEQSETCSTPLCYDNQNLQKVRITITTYSDGSTTISRVPTGVCCR